MTDYHQGMTDQQQKGTPRPSALVFPSRSGGQPHVVTVLADERLACTCMAYLGIDRNPAGCWAMKATRDLLALPVTTVTAEVNWSDL